MDERTDIISLVPTLILEQIIQYVDISSVAQCFKVSKEWRKIFSDLKIESKLQTKWRFGKPELLKRDGFTDFNIKILGNFERIKRAPRVLRSIRMMNFAKRELR